MYGIPDKYDIREKYPIYWFDKSSSLRLSAGILWNTNKDCLSQETKNEIGLPENLNLPAGIQSVFEMLCGLSLELVFKAIIIAADEEFDKDHNLTGLARKTGLVLDENAHITLEFLAASVIWGGKYPIPKQKNAMIKSENLHIKNLPRGGTLLSYTKKYNEICGWHSFNKIWSSASDLFWSMDGREGPTSLF